MESGRSYLDLRAVDLVYVAVKAAAGSPEGAVLEAGAKRVCEQVGVALVGCAVERGEDAAEVSGVTRLKGVMPPLALHALQLPRLLGGMQSPTMPLQLQVSLTLHMYTWSIPSD